MTNEHRRLTLYLHDPPLLSVLEHVHVHVCFTDFYFLLLCLFFCVSDYFCLIWLTVSEPEPATSAVPLNPVQFNSIQSITC